MGLRDSKTSVESHSDVDTERNINVFITAIKTGIVGFTNETRTLIFVMPSGSTTHDLLDNINKFRNPTHKISSLANKIGIAFDDVPLINNKTYFIGFD